MNYLLPILYILGLYRAYLAGSFYLRVRSDEQTPASKTRTFPRTTLFLFLLVAIPTTLQFLFPDLLMLFQRDAARFMSGQSWRLVTSLFVQDGGVSGTVFNLVSLWLIGFVAEQFWGNKGMLVLFFAGGIVGQLIGLVWQPIGAAIRSPTSAWRQVLQSFAFCAVRPDSCRSQHSWLSARI